MAGLPPPSYTTDAAAPEYTATAPVAASAGGALPAHDVTGSPPHLVPSEGINEKVPNHFHVSNKFIYPLVQPSDLEAQLVLLGAFHRLREDVRTQKGKEDISLQPDERWAIFLERAVYRFECWALGMIGGSPGEGDVRLLLLDERPPLDVMMVWHTYMLNPRTYHEDCLRKFPGLFKMGCVSPFRRAGLKEIANVTHHRSFPLSQLCSTIDKESLVPHFPTESRVAAFASFTGQPFDPPLNTTSEDTVILFCPGCSQPNSVPWITRKGDGYGQRAFSTGCSSCSMTFNREVRQLQDHHFYHCLLNTCDHQTLCVRKFCEDVERCGVDPDHNSLA